MAGGNAIAAEILEASAAGYAAAASALLEQAAVPQQAGAGTTWRAHFMQRILELAAAVRLGEPELFARRQAWLRRAFLARGQDEAQLKRALASLRQALARELPEAMQASVEAPIASAFAALDEELEVQGDEPTAAGRLARDYVAACLEGEPDRAIALVMGAVRGGMPATDVYLKVLVPAQQEVGQLWHVADIGIAEERIVSETTRNLMMLLSGSCAPANENGKKLLAASIAGNAHDIGLRMVTDLFRLAGWKCLFLGASVPGEEIARAARQFGAELVVLNATLTPQLKMLGDCIAAIRRAAPGARILVGGHAFDGAPDLWRQLGAHGYAPDMKTALATGAALLGD